MTIEVSKIFARPFDALKDSPIIQDVALPQEDGTFKGGYSGKSQAQMESEGYVLFDYDEWEKKSEAVMTTEPRPISEAHYHEMSGVLPPGGYGHGNNAESWYLIEFYSGRITDHFVRLHRKELTLHFTFRAPVMKHHDDRLKVATDYLSKGAGHILKSQGLEKTHWGRRIIEAEARGHFLAGDYAASGNWFSCACGKLDDHIERDSTFGVPKDDTLSDLGMSFDERVTNDDFVGAAVLLILIEKRSIELAGEKA